jgi:hypothetical protein
LPVLKANASGCQWRWSTINPYDPALGVVAVTFLAARRDEVRRTNADGSARMLDRQPAPIASSREVAGGSGRRGLGGADHLPGLERGHPAAASGRWPRLPIARRPRSSKDRAAALRQEPRRRPAAPANSARTQAAPQELSGRQGFRFRFGGGALAVSARFGSRSLSWVTGRRTHRVTFRRPQRAGAQR